MRSLELIVIGASAGGLDGLMAIVRGLPSDSPPVLVAMHTSSSGTTYLPQILARVSKMAVEFATDGARLRRGRVIIAPPDFHLLVTPRSVSLSRGPRENGFRPAIDPLFRSAAAHYGPRTMGVILSGALDDGAYGMKVLKGYGGVTVVQDPDEAAIPSMPRSVLATVDVDHVLTAAQIARLISEYSRIGARGTAVKSQRQPPALRDPEPQDAARVMEVQDMRKTFGPPSGLTCPDCGGALWEIADDSSLRYRCHVGHQFSPDALESQHRDSVEGALWTAVRILEEHADLRERMADRARGAGLAVVQAGFLENAKESHRQAEIIRRLLFSRSVPPPAESSSPRRRSTKRSQGKPAKSRRKP